MERIRITGAGSELQGVGRLSDGRAVFVPGALPGEEVEIEISREARRFCEGRLLRVLEVSPERVEPACPHAGSCGGCAARHMRYGATLRMKRQRVVDALERIGGVSAPLVFETIGCAEPERCRNKAEYGVEAHNSQVRVGPMEGRSHRVLPVSDCLLQTPQSVRALRWLTAHLAEYDCAPRIRDLVTRTSRAGELAVVLSGVGRSQGDARDLAEAMRRDLPELISVHYCALKPRPAHALDGECAHVLGARTMTDALLGLSFELSPQSFFQVNPPQAEALYRRALEAIGLGEEASGELASPRARRAEGAPLRVLDAYCGAGTITLAAAARGAQCTGVEIVAPAVENARRNAERNGLSGRARFLCGDAAREIPRLIAGGERFDAAILDPPRRGAEAALLNALAEAEIPRLAYVSCDPGTLARDVKLLTGRGYALRWAQPVDMFPWTGHVETVALLTLPDGGASEE